MALGGGCFCRFLLAVAAVVVLALAVIGLLYLIQWKHPTPLLYFASINSVSGVGDDQPVQFVLTLGVEPRSPLFSHPCIDKDTTVDVAYHGVTIVNGTINPELCGVPRKLWTVWREVIVLQRPGNVSGLPEFVVDGMVADASLGVQLFDVTMHIPSTGGDGDDDDGKLVSCMARQVGVDNSLSNACDVHYARSHV